MNECAAFEPWSGVSIFCWISQFQVFLAALVALIAAGIAYRSAKLHINLEKRRDGRMAAAARMETLLLYQGHVTLLASMAEKISMLLAEYSDEQLYDAIDGKLFTPETVPSAIASYPAGAQSLPAEIRLGLSAVFTVIHAWNDFIRLVNGKPFGPDRQSYINLVPSLRDLAATCESHAPNLPRSLMNAIGEADEVLGNV